MVTIQHLASAVVKANKTFAYIITKMEFLFY